MANNMTAKHQHVRQLSLSARCRMLMLAAVRRATMSTTKKCKSNDLFQFLIAYFNIC